MEFDALGEPDEVADVNGDERAVLAESAAEDIVVRDASHTPVTDVTITSRPSRCS